MHATTERGLFTGNRGCLLNDDSRLVRHHNGSLWIICLTAFRDWQHPLDAPRTWTPLFFLDDAVALAAGHRPCGLCRRADYLDYRQAVTDAATRSGAHIGDGPILAGELNRRLARERLRRGRGLDRADDRITTVGHLDDLPPGTVVTELDDPKPMLLTEESLQAFSFKGWGPPAPRPADRAFAVLTPPTSLAALRHGFTPTLHSSAQTTRNGSQNTP